MKNPKAASQTKKVLWRISEAAPQGEIVDANTFAKRASIPDAAARKESPEVSYGNWLESSFELLNGTEVNDGPDTVPDELFDELFAPTAVVRVPPEK